MFNLEYVGTAEWLDGVLAQQVAEATENAADYREVMNEEDYELDDYEDSDGDVEGDGPREDDEPVRPPVVFAPLPPGAGVTTGPVRGSRARLALQPAPEVDEFTARVRAVLAASV